jgi:hypothetical protein
MRNRSSFIDDGPGGLIFAWIETVFGHFLVRHDIAIVLTVLVSMCAVCSLEHAGNLAAPMFIQYGQDNALAPDGFVYAHFPFATDFGEHFHS